MLRPYLAPSPEMGAAIEAAEELQAAEIYLNEATPELVDRAICRYNAADERLKWLLREAKLAMGIKVDWEKIKEKRLEKMANEQA